MRKPANELSRPAIDAQQRARGIARCGAGEHQGGGDDFWRPLLLQSSDFISSCEDMEGVNFDATNRKRLKSYRNSILKILGYMLLLLDKTKERKA